MLPEQQHTSRLVPCTAIALIATIRPRSDVNYRCIICLASALLVAATQSQCLGPEVDETYSLTIPQVSEEDLLSIQNMAHFEGSHLPDHVETECRQIAATVLVRRVHGGYRSYRHVIESRGQFAVYDAVLLCNGDDCRPLTDGLSTASATHYYVYSTRYQMTDRRRREFERCAAAIADELTHTPNGGYYFFASAGDGTNAFRSWYELPGGLNVLAGDGTGELPGDDPGPPTCDECSDSCDASSCCGYQPSECTSEPPPSPGLPDYPDNSGTANGDECSREERSSNETRCYKADGDPDAEGDIQYCRPAYTDQCQHALCWQRIQLGGCI